ncbi:response regulator transcription factor [Enterococcus sp. DIV0756]|uniref:response regulator transcription factor n=1 Tax=Enterococcus sp. DIV0756 TaxID=2774636 RepID=UPI003F223BF5
MRVLIIDDDPILCKLLQSVFEKQNWQTKVALDGIKALDLMKSTPFDLLLLDLNLPLKSGDRILVELREFSNIPVIIISAKELVTTKIDLLKIGADDYITKPFDIDEVLARAEAVVRRNAKYISESQQFKNLTLNTEERTVLVKQQEILLTAKEFSILKLLMENPKKIFSKRNIFESVWKEPYHDDGHTINVHVSSLRMKLAEADQENDYIETVWGVGYRLKKRD